MFQSGGLAGGGREVISEKGWNCDALSDRQDAYPTGAVKLLAGID